MLFSPSYEILDPKYVNIFTFSNIVLSVIILLLIGTYPLNAITLDFSGDTFIPNCSILIFILYDTFLH